MPVCTTFFIACSIGMCTVPCSPVDPVIRVEPLLLVRAEAREIGARVRLQARAGRLDASGWRSASGKEVG